MNNERFEFLEKHSQRIVELGNLIDNSDTTITKIGFMKYEVNIIINFSEDKQGRASNTAYAFSENHAYIRVKAKAIKDIIKWEEEHEPQG